MPEISINSIEYSNPGEIHIFGRDPEGVSRHLRVTDFKPYFYCPLKQALDIKHPRNVFPDLGTEFVSIYGEPVRRLYTETPMDVREVRDKYQNFEADVLFTSRFMIDCGLTGGISAPGWISDYRKVKPVEVNAPTRVCMVDIECDSSVGWPSPMRDAIICVTCHDSFEKHYMTFLLLAPGSSYTPGEPMENGCFDLSRHTVCVFKDEKKMLLTLGQYIKSIDPDILTGWNFTLFDLNYIVQRLITLEISLDVLSRLRGASERNPLRGRVGFDLLAGYKKMHQQQEESYRLDAIGAKEIGKQKVHFTGNISDLWKQNPAELINYNFVDVELCVRIDAKNGIVDFFRGISSFVGIPMDRALNSSSVVDVYVLRKAHGKYVLPTKGEKKEEESFEGAMVFPPLKGIHENVVVLDLKSLYPMIMITGNMSPETKDPNGDITSPKGTKFRSSPDGLVRSVVMELLEKRDSLKAEMKKYDYNSPEYKRLDMAQATVKVIMNTYYGVSGHSGFRLYDREIGAAVASTGQKILEHNRKIVEDEGYVVIYGDTDSVGTKMPVEFTREQTISEAKRLEKLMNDSYSKFAKDVLNADKSYFSVKFEKLYERYFSGGRKKRYAGLLSWKEGKDVHDIDVVGFEVRRSDSPVITRSTQKTLIGMILDGKTFEDVKVFMGEIITAYRSGKYSLDEIGIPGGIGKDLEDYDRPDAQVRGAMYANKYLGSAFGQGSKPKRLYIKEVTGKYPRTDVVCFEYGDQVPPEFVVDVETMLEKTIMKPIMRILEALGWHWNEMDPRITTWADWGPA